MTHLKTMAEYANNAQALSLLHTASYLTTWLYLATYPSGRRGWWIRFGNEPERDVDGCELEAVAGFKAGRQVYPD